MSSPCFRKTPFSFYIVIQLSRCIKRFKQFLSDQKFDLYNFMKCFATKFIFTHCHQDNGVKVKPHPLHTLCGRDVVKRVSKSYFLARTKWRRIMYSLCHAGQIDLDLSLCGLWMAFISRPTTLPLAFIPLPSQARTLLHRGNTPLLPSERLRGPSTHFVETISYDNPSIGCVSIVHLTLAHKSHVFS